MATRTEVLDVGRRDHVVLFYLFYRDEQQLTERVSEYLLPAIQGGVAIVVTTPDETPDLFSTGWLSQFTVCHLADNAIALNYHCDHSAVSRSLAIFKTRASNHDPAMRQFSIGPNGISLQDTAIPGTR